jgi:small-conductance mechanosensitive channel
VICSTLRLGVHAARHAAVVSVVALAVVLSWAVPVASQETTPPAAPTPTPIEAFDTSDIPDRATELRRDLERMVPREADTSLAEAAIAALPQFETEIDTLQVHLNDALEEPVSLRVLKDERVNWAMLDARLDAMENGLERQARDITRTRSRLGTLRSQWSTTLDAAADRGDPPVVRRQAREALDTITQADVLLEQRVDPILDAQARVGALRSDVEDAIERIDQRTSAFGRDLLRPDSVAVWRALDPDTEYRFHFEPLRSTVRERLRQLSVYVRGSAESIALQALVWLVLGSWLHTVRRRHADDPPADHGSENVVVKAPFTVAMLVAIIVGIPLHTSAPRAWPEMLYVVVLVALARLAAAALPRRTAGAVVALAVVAGLHWLATVVPDVHPVDRWLWLAVSVLGAVVIPLVAKPVLTVFGDSNRLWAAARSRMVTAVTAALGMSAIANLVGLVDLAVVVTGGVMTSLYIAAVMWTLARILDGIAGLVLRADWARRSRIVRDHGDVVRDGLRRVVRLLAVASWIVATMDAFLLWTPLLRGGQRALQASFTVGSLTISLGSVLAAIVAVWIALTISRVIRFFFEEEVASRVALPPGVPATMSRLIHYVILVIGVFLALAAAGIELGQLAIVFGAFGVGIGFGLQTIVNNFISGLILMFERPIRVGDVVQLGTLSGTVTTIGIRASRVRTWDGSDVVVPNGNLISSELINWTLSDVTRRLELPVGVAYGTDPERVIELLGAAMRGHDKVLRTPEPYALFVGFGDSSLNFSARCWCRFDDSIHTASDLHVAFNRALAEAGIEIPFPQRDLHLRSIDPDVSWPGTHAATSSEIGPEAPPPSTGESPPEGD